MDAPAPPRFLAVDHLEFAVADVDRAAEAHHRLGFAKVATRELRERRLYSLRLVSGRTSIVLSQSRLDSDPIARAVAEHGDGVFSIGFLCQDALAAVERLHQRGGRVVEAPRTVQVGDPPQTQTQAQVLAFGHVRHTLVSRQGGPFLEGFPPAPNAAPAGFGLDRVVGWTAYVEARDFPAESERYRSLLGLAPDGEPGTSRRRWKTVDGAFVAEMATAENDLDPAREFLAVNHGSGVGEVAFATTGNREETLRRIVAAGLEVDRETGLTAPIVGHFRYRVL